MIFRACNTLYNNNMITQVTSEHTFCYDVDNIERNVINVYPEVKYQTITGFGGALTESAGYVLSKMSDEKYEEVMQAYFGKRGIGYSIARTHLDSCDFSLSNYAAVEDENDSDFSTFSLERDAMYVQPLIRKAEKALGKSLPLMITPWSPLAHMKSTRKRNNGGKLKIKYYKDWARYIVKYIKEYKKLGFNIYEMSIQNEPNATTPWDSCLFSSEEEKSFLKDYLFKEMKAEGLDDVKILIWDHNKERIFDRARDIIDESTSDMIHGIAFHWYSGDHFDALRMTKEMFPDKELVFSEGCVEYSMYGNKSNQLKNAQMYAHEYFGNLNAGTSQLIDWNIVLDSKGGPNHVGNFCDAPIMCDIEKDKIHYNLSYYYISHFSKYIKPGAVRIGCSNFSKEIEVTAFQNVDGTYAIVVMNPTDKEFVYTLRIGDQVTTTVLHAQSIITYY